MKAVVFSEATHDMLHSLPGQNFSSQVVWSPGVSWGAATHDVRGGYEWSKANRLVKRKEQAGINIPPGGKLNPRFVCSWRSYARHWMRNTWFWQTIQFMIFAVPLCFGFFLAFYNVFCIHELPKSASFFCSFLEICRF